MAKIAIALEQALLRRAAEGVPGQAAARLMAQGEGWTVRDVVCTSNPQDCPYEERHKTICIAIVVAGSFQYRSQAGQELTAPGSLLLGNAGQAFECGHEHGAGDRCISFSYGPPYFEALAADAGGHGGKLDLPCSASRPCVHCRLSWRGPVPVWFAINAKAITQPGRNSVSNSPRG